MLLDFEIAHCSRRCAATGRALAPGEAIVSCLRMEAGVAVRDDYAAAEWPGAAAEHLAWWRSRLPGGGAKPTLAPSDVLLNLFAELAEAPGEAEFRYVLGLLLVRRRLLRVEDTLRSAQGETLTLECPRRNERFELRVAPPAAERVAQVEARLAELLYGGA